MSSLHSSLKTSTEKPWPGFFINGDPSRPGEPPLPAGSRHQKTERAYKPEDDRSRYVSPSYDDEEDDEEEDEEDDVDEEEDESEADISRRI